MRSTTLGGGRRRWCAGSLTAVTPLSLSNWISIRVVRHAAVSNLLRRWLMHAILFLDSYRHLWHTPEEIDAASLRAQKNTAEKAPKDAANLALQRALSRLLLADVVRMPDGDGTVYGSGPEKGVSGAEQPAREGDEADV